MLEITLHVEGLEEISKTEAEKSFNSFTDDVFSISDTLSGEDSEKPIYYISDIAITHQRDKFIIIAAGTMDDVELYDHMLAEIEIAILKNFPSFEGVLETTMKPYSIK